MTTTATRSGQSVGSPISNEAYNVLTSLQSKLEGLEAYRKYAGSTQLVTVILSSNGANFPKHEDELYGILYSTKLVH